MIDRQTLGNIVPLAAVAIALAEYVFDHTTPRYASPWFWAALVATVGLLNNTARRSICCALSGGGGQH